jgi:protein phosphatase
MRHLLSQLRRPNQPDHTRLDEGWSWPTGPAMFASALVLPGQEQTRFFLILVMLLIVFLFVAVAIVLPITMRISGKRQKTKARPASPPPPPPDNTPAPIASPPDQAADSINPALAETAPSLPALEDLAATSPSLRTIAAERPVETRPISGQRPHNMGWRIAGLSDTGLRRELNEDNLIMLEKEMPLGLYVVADGMGGHDAGEVASGLTITAIQRHFEEYTPTSTTPLAEWLRSAAMVANQVVLTQQGDREEERKMGSTLVMALVTDGQAHIANVGDSRAYRLTSTTIEQISVDHSLVERLVQIGQLTREEARTHKQKNVIYSTIGDKEDMEISLYEVNLQPGDRLLLCSDGLSGMLTDPEILLISQQNPDPAAACKALIEAAKMAGGHDNITAVIVQMNDGA